MLRLLARVTCRASNLDSEAGQRASIVFEEGVGMAKSRFAEQGRVALKGSARKPFKPEAQVGALERAGESVAEAGITVSVVVKGKAPIPPATGAGQARMTREEFADQCGADPASVAMVKAFAEEFGLTVDDSPAGRCTVHLHGTVTELERAFGVTLNRVETSDGAFRVREGSVHIPQELEGHVVAVLGLDNRPQAQPQFRIARANAVTTSYTPVQVGALYGFPKDATASGQTIGLIELGGGFAPADITTYFEGLGLAVPTVTAVSVDGGTNAPGDPNGADGEVMLDIEVSASVAPGAKVAVYFAPNTDQGFIDAVSMAVHDTVNKPSVISISWGGPESTWTTQATTALDAACQAAAAVGVTITVAAGDNGSTDGVSGTASHVDFPASSPHVLACGGTTLEGSGTRITSEVVWNEQASDEGATGGGVSNVFPLPTWQENSDVPKPTTKGGGRGVPDVTGNADPSTGYQVRVDGESQVIGGTSAVAPLWAGLIALANAQNGVDAGFVNPTLYGTGAAGAFRDITQGNNGAFTAGPGWDACSGQGSPVGLVLVSLLKNF
jgi:kumamolisin